MTSDSASGPPGVTLSIKNLTAITLFVDDLPSAAAFYRDVFGLREVFADDNSTAFDLGNTIVNLLLRSEAPELIGPAPVADAAAGSHMQLTVTVDDVDATCAVLAERGVPLINGPLDRPWGVRTAAFADPAGHVWEVAAPVRDGGASQTGEHGVDPGRHP